MAGKAFVFINSNGDQLRCPMHALARQVIHMRMHNAKDWDYL
jgi:hypothetical protein